MLPEFRRVPIVCSLLKDYASFHHEHDTLEYANVLGRVARHGNHVGIVAGFELTDLAAPPQEFRAIDQVSLENCTGSHAVLDHQFKFTRLRPVREWTDI